MEPRFEREVRAIVDRFVGALVSLVRDDLEAHLRAFSTGPAKPAPTPPRPPRTKATAPALPSRSRRPAFAPAPKVRGPVHASEHVDRMVEIVRTYPWPPQSRELQRLLGVKKDPFLRIADLAIATGRVRREGQKAGIRYLYVDAG